MSVINFNNMIPVAPGLYTRMEFVNEKDRFLLQKEYAFCKKNASVLTSKAEDVYNRYKDGLMTSAEMGRTVNFPALEAALKAYLSAASQSAVPGAAAASQQAPAASAADPASSIPGAPTDASTASSASGEAPALDQTGAASAASPQLLSMVATIAAQPSAPGAQKQSVKKNEIVNE